MISQTAQSSDSVTLGGVSHAFKTWGLKVSIIDFTLSRVHTGQRPTHFLRPRVTSRKSPVTSLNFQGTCDERAWLRILHL